MPPNNDVFWHNTFEHIYEDEDEEDEEDVDEHDKDDNGEDENVSENQQVKMRRRSMERGWGQCACEEWIWPWALKE